MARDREPETKKLGADGRFERLDRLRLAIVAGPGSGTTFESSGERVTVGTHETCDLVLGDGTVSRFHLELLLGEGRVRLRDLGSRNGTLVDGVPVTEAPLRPGATITVGKTQLRFEREPAAAKVALSQRTRFGVLVGTAPSMRKVFSLLERAAATDVTVLLEGETGTGKEAAAESIHRESARKDGPFVVVDCAAIPAELLESELFGHEKGAFTGAVASRRGAFEAASGGTVFLDEIGELAPDLQPKLLRVLERHEVKRVGRAEYTSVDVRVIAATNRNLQREVNEKRFRSDLYYRLAVVNVRLPALRERTEDLPMLVRHLLGPPSAETAPLETEAFLGDLARHAWPGNVRELRNYLERCLALRETQLPEVEAAPPAEGAPTVDASVPLKQAREGWLEPFERRYCEELLRRHEGNVTAAARAAGVDRITFYRLLWRLGLR